LIYFANPSTPAVRGAMDRGQLGCILTPAQGNRLPSGAVWIADNGCGPGSDGQPGSGYPGDRGYLLWLSRLSARARRRCLFAVAPDVLCDAQATLERSERFTVPLRASGLPVALVAQNGLEHLDVPWAWFDILFIGGDTAWKLGAGARSLIAEAKARGKRVHMGRVNSLRRLRYADATGCDSADGTIIARAPDRRLPEVLGWLHRIGTEPPLWDLADRGPDPLRWMRGYLAACRMAAVPVVEEAKAS
jgi:hypothetical protein